MDVSVVIVNWNSKQDLARCLVSIVAHTKDVEYEVVIIDSGSHDGSREMVSEEYPSVTFVQSETNLGFARANNRAFEETTGDVVLFLNPDTELTGPTVALMASQVRSRPDVGIVGCRLLNSDGTLQSSCVQAMPTITNQLLNSNALRHKYPRSPLWGMAALYDEGDAAREVEAISGACLALTRHAFEEVGRFSEDYFMYAEDIDLAYKVRLAGYKNYYLPNSTVIHYGGNSSQQAGSAFAAVMLPEAIWRFLRKTRGKAYASGYRAAMCVSAIARVSVIGVGSMFSNGAAAISLKRALQKWRSVLSWTLFQDGIVGGYYRNVR